MINVLDVAYLYLPDPVGTPYTLYIWLAIPFVEQLHPLTPVLGLDDPGCCLWPVSIQGRATGLGRRQVKWRIPLST